MPEFFPNNNPPTEKSPAQELAELEGKIAELRAELFILDSALNPQPIELPKAPKPLIDDEDVKQELREIQDFAEKTQSELRGLGFNEPLKGHQAQAERDKKIKMTLEALKKELGSLLLKRYELLKKIEQKVAVPVIQRQVDHFYLPDESYEYLQTHFSNKEPNLIELPKLSRAFELKPDQSLEKLKENIRLILAESTKFYYDHKLFNFASNINKDLDLNDHIMKIIFEAINEGFNCGMFFPAPAIQESSTEDVIRQTSTTDYIANEVEQLNLPMIPDEIKGLPIIKRPGRGYLILFQYTDMPTATENLDLSETRQLFVEHQWSGLNMYEYLILERMIYQKSRAHLLGRNNGNKFLTRLLDANNSEQETIYAGWSPTLEIIIMMRARFMRKEDCLGTRPVIIVPIFEK